MSTTYAAETERSSPRRDRGRGPGWLATHDLTHAGLLALHALQAGPLTQRQLAAANRVEEQTMSRVVARLGAPGM